MWTRYFDSTLETDFGRVDEQKYFILTGKVAKTTNKAKEINRTANINVDLLIQDDVDKESDNDEDSQNSSHNSKKDLSKNDSSSQIKQNGNFLSLILLLGRKFAKTFYTEAIPSKMHYPKKATLDEPAQKFIKVNSSWSSNSNI